MEEDTEVGSALSAKTRVCRLLGKMADSRARAGLVQDEPRTSCCERKEVLKKDRASHKDTGASSKWFPTDQIWDNLNTKIIQYSNEL